MQISDMRKAFWGYRIEDVYKYYDEVSKEYLDKLKKAADEYEKRVAELEKENSAMQSTISLLQEENNKLKEHEAVVANAVIDAKVFAEKLRSDAESVAAEQKKELQNELLAGKNKAEEVLESVTACKQVVIAQLESLRDTLETTEVKVQSVIDKGFENHSIIDQCVPPNLLSLFVLNKGE